MFSLALEWGFIYVICPSQKERDILCKFRGIFSVGSRSIGADGRTRQKKTIKGPFDS